MAFLDKIKKLVNAFLATENDKYLTTESGLKLQILDIGFHDSVTKSAGSWGDKSITGGSWGDKSKTP